MKKFFLLLMAAATFNANAALISITTDKDTYNVGETITATVSASKLSVGGVQTYFNGYIALFNFDSLFLSLDVSSIMDLGALGVRPEVKTSDSDGNTLSIDAVENLFAPFDPTFQGAIFAQEGKDVVELFSFSLLALNAGLVELTPTSIVLGQGGSPQSGNTTESTSFTIAEVPAPGTFALSLLALGGMFFARKRVKS